MNHKIKDLLTEGKGLFLALDQGLEHGSKDFNLKTIDVKYILNIAVKGEYNGVILQKGLAEHYIDHYRFKIPLILKVNGKTSLTQNEPYAPQVCSIGKAVELKAKAIGYTIYLGSAHEHIMLKEFSRIQEEAHEYGLPVIAWIYPRGTFIQDEKNTDVLAYAARVGQELGADFVKIKYNHDPEGFTWIVKCAGETKVLVAGGEKTTVEKLLKEVDEVMKCGANGLAIGRNVWQHEKPLAVTNALKAIIFGRKKVESALKLLKGKNV